MVTSGNTTVIGIVAQQESLIPLVYKTVNVESTVSETVCV